MKHITVMLAACAMPIATPALAQRTAPAAPAPVDASVAALRDAALKDDLAYDIVEGLTTEVGQRLAATEAEARARDWAVAKLDLARLQERAYRDLSHAGLAARRRDRGDHRALSAEADADRARQFGSDARRGVTLPVVVFKTYGDLVAAPAGSLKGKIAYIGNAMEPTQDGSSYGAYGVARFVGPSIAAAKGAAAVVIRSVGTDHHRNPHTGGTNWAEGVKPIPAAALSVPDALQLERIAARGKPVTMHLTLTPRFAGEGTSGNVIAEVPGSDPAAGIVLVGGHLDSWDLGTGAIDDASGVAITTAAAKRIMDAGQPKRTIRVVWFGAEEPGGFGGKEYARVHGSEKHATASESDFGADRIWRVETNLPASAAAVGERLTSALAPLGIAKGRGVAGDGTDVEPTLALGVAGIDLNQSGTRYFDTHHTPDDTLDRIDPEQLRQNVAAWTAMLAVVANAPETIGSVTPRK